MTRWRIKVEHQGSVAKVRGWRASELIADAGLKPFFAGGGWMVNEHRLPDLLAYLDRRGIAVEVTGGNGVSTRLADRARGADAPRAGASREAPAPEFPRFADFMASRTQSPAPESVGEADEGADVPLWGPGGDAA